MRQEHVRTSVDVERYGHKRHCEISESTHLTSIFPAGGAVNLTSTIDVDLMVGVAAYHTPTDGGVPPDLGTATSVAEQLDTAADAADEEEELSSSAVARVHTSHHEVLRSSIPASPVLPKVTSIPSRSPFTLMFTKEKRKWD
jgi:hypothetical protein